MNRIINADCVVGLRSLETGSVDLTVTSPPYDKVRDFAPFDFESTAQELWQVTRDGGIVVWVVGDQIVEGSETGTSFRQALYFREIGFRLHHTMVYAPTGTLFATQTRYGAALQYMFVLSKGRPKTIQLIRDKKNVSAGFWQNLQPYRDSRGRKRNYNRQPIRKWGLRGPVWPYSVGGGRSATDKHALGHPALMPELLARDHILTWSRPGDLILDPFAGAGTTCKVAVLLGRRYIGFEIEKRFCEMAKRRVRAAIIGALQ